MSNDSSGDLTEKFRRLIARTGPISLAQFMGESNANYYNSRDPLGHSGDFITAPEISQIFGELVGLWLADIWTRAGKPEPIHYVELGPGRGTLAVDALRAASRFGLNPQVHFVEGSQSLRALQGAALSGAVHHDDPTTLPDDAPLLLVANEFFDALPIRQLVRAEEGWRERLVALDGEEFVFVPGTVPMDAALPEGMRNLEVGSVVETCSAAAAICSELADRLVRLGGAALIIDYGFRKLEAGETLQALRAHKKVSIFDHPGEADLTAHVDFEALGNVVQNKGARLIGVEEQGRWLTAMGLDARSDALARQSPEKAEILARQRERLIAPDQMGELFKVMGFSSPDWPEGAGFN
jgi:NADH dehydrogenase [ubiquinone] 1 alpha subcomplex assembly factor 7